MKNKLHFLPNIFENKWFHLGISLGMAGAIALVLLFVPLTIVSPQATSPQSHVFSFPFGVSLVQAAGGLTITKSAPEFVAQGGILTYTLRITNDTGSVITQASVIDPWVSELTNCNRPDVLPDGWDAYCNSPNNMIFSYNGSNLTNATLVYWGRVTEPLASGHKIVNSGYQITQTIVAGAYSFGPPVTTTVLGPSWEITKTPQSSTLDPSQPFNYTITVYNRGGSASSGLFTVTEQLPNDAHYVAGTAVPPGTLVGSTLTWTSTAPINANGSTQFTFQITVTESLTDGWPVANSIYNVSGGNVLTPTTSGDPITVTVDSPADLNISKTASANPVTVGGQLVYTLTVSNNGAGPALGVVVTDTLSSNVAYDASAILDGTGTITDTGGNPIIFGLGNIASGNSVRMLITTSVATTLPNPATIENIYQASATNGQAASDSPNIVTVQPSSTRTLTLSVGSTSLQICETTPVTALVMDNFGNPVTGQIITLNAIPANNSVQFLPDMTNSVSGATNSNGVFLSTMRGLVSGTPAFVLRAQSVGFPDQYEDINMSTPAIPAAITVTVSPPGVATGENSTVTAQVRDCRGLAVSGETVTFTVDSLATITPPGTDTTDSNGNASVTVTAGGSPGTATITGTVVGPLSDTDELNIGVPSLDITKSATPAGGNVTAGDTITYTVIVENSGAVAVTNVMITDTLDTDVNFVSGSLAPGGTPPTNDNGTLTFSAAALGVGNNLTATIVVEVNTSAVSNTFIANTATVGSDQTGDTDSNTILHQVVEDTGKVFLPIILKN